MRRSQSVAGDFCPMFQTCALPELSQKSRCIAGSVSVLTMLKKMASKSAREHALNQRARLQGHDVDGDAHLFEALLEHLGAAFERGVAAIGQHGEAGLGPGSVLEPGIGVAIGEAHSLRAVPGPSPG